MPRGNDEHFLLGVIIVGGSCPTFAKISESADASKPFVDKDGFDSKDAQKSHERISAFSFFSLSRPFLWLFIHVVVSCAYVLFVACSVCVAF